MTAVEVIDAVESAGGWLWLEGESCRYKMPRKAEHLLPDLRAHRKQIYRVLMEREHAMLTPVPCTCSEKA
jgi:hypothetical protein